MNKMQIIKLNINNDNDKARLTILYLLKFNYLKKYAPYFREFVVNKILKPANIKPRDYEGQIIAIATWLQDNIYYTFEHKEAFQSPIYTLKNRFGDCDCQALLASVMYESIGFKSRFLLLGRYNKEKKKNVFFHILNEVQKPKESLDKEFYPVDTIHKFQPMVKYW